MRILFLFLFLCIAPCWIFAQYEKFELIPYPSELFPGRGHFEINENTKIVASGAGSDEVELFVAWLSKATGHRFDVSSDSDPKSSNCIFFTSSRDASVIQQKLPELPGNLNASGSTMDPGAYKIVVDSSRVLISAPFDVGVFYATQTLKQLLPCPDKNGHIALPVILQELRIIDKPKFSHRGLLLDCCRHFMTVDFIKKYIDLLAYYKMNVLHWHLTEDQGWRIQIDKYPLLTEVGAWRIEENGERYGGFYSKDDIREIVRYASARHVAIIPEIEIPGHCTAAIAAYPYLSCTGEKIVVENEWGVFKDIYCAGKDSTIAFLENVLAEVCELFPSQYIHIGGDEAPKFRWEQCSLCQNRMANENLADESELQTWFIERIAMYLKSKGKSIIGWDEILEGGIPSDAMVQSWRGMEGGMKAAKEGHGVVMSPTSHCYFDYGLEAIDMRKVYSFDPIPSGLSTSEAANIRGGECNMWTEHAPQDLVDSKVFPRLLAMSEVLWTHPQQKSYEIFMHRVEAHYPRLNSMNVDFGFPEIPVAMSCKQGLAGEMLVALDKKLPDSVLRYRIIKPGHDIADDTKTWPEYKQPISVTSLTKIEVGVEFLGRHLPVSINGTFDPHLGYGKPITISYEPSASYSGGGKQALADGRIGSNNFRDGIWQALQGSNMEAFVDLGEIKTIESISSNWFHYGNAWIFNPSVVSYYYSLDGVSWQLFADVNSELDDHTPGELMIAMSAHRNDSESVKARFVKMIAVNRGPCPEWHDAPGEPSWLFCDELIVH